MNSTSTEYSFLARSIENKDSNDPEDKDENGFLLIRDKKKKREGINKTPTKKSFNDQCFLRNIFEKFGSIYLFDLNNLILLISRIRIVNFPMNKDIFEKGKKEKGNINLIHTIPEIKYWNQRYYYYSRYDEGIKMDYESWYSVTPEELASYISLAVTDKNSIVVDAFCGSGGNVIHFSKNCKHVYAIDIDPIKLDICKNNTKVYNCRDNIEFILSDFLLMENKIKADYIFLSPPWGGVEYKDSEYYSMKHMITPNIFEIIRVCLSIGRKIIFYLPRTILIGEIFEILQDVIKSTNREKDFQSHMYLDVHILNSGNKIKAVMLIFGNELKEISQEELKHYLEFNYKSITENELIKLLNLKKLIGAAKFFRSEYAFRKNYNELHTVLNSLMTKNNCLIHNLIKFLELEVLTLNEMNEYKNLNSLSYVTKNQLLTKEKVAKLPCKIKTYFVNGKIMTEEEYHYYRDNLYTQPT